MVEISEAEFDQADAINNKSAFLFLKEAGKSVSDHGKVCTLVTSLLGAYTPFYAAYAGTKAPVEHYTRAASKEFGERGISTGLTDIEDIVPYIRFMVSEGWWMTGQTILVNGGYCTK
ncbi:short chain dehydrogenase mdpC-like [Anopheles merus]|uniref:short chain dehydrogenase mdpC-like n=1 Tax=Anopheles merus TaxID=30066 RepID=UPI001BE41039|nr:short chain dehydrogenase mdpC-like [Anopheles merus]